MQCGRFEKTFWQPQCSHLLAGIVNRVRCIIEDSHDSSSDMVCIFARLVSNLIMLSAGPRVTVHMDQSTDTPFSKKLDHNAPKMVSGCVN